MGHFWNRCMTRNATPRHLLQPIITTRLLINIQSAKRFSSYCQRRSNSAPAKLPTPLISCQQLRRMVFWVRKRKTWLRVWRWGEERNILRENQDTLFGSWLYWDRNRLIRKPTAVNQDTLFGSWLYWDRNRLIRKPTAVIIRLLKWRLYFFCFFAF